MRNVFEYLVNTGMEQLDLIADAEKKALICADLAKAIAQSGLLSGSVTVEEKVETQEPKEEKKTTKKSTKKNSKKDALKPEASKVETTTTEIVEEEIEVPQAPEVTEVTEEVPQEPVMEETIETPQEPVAEVEMVDEWTDEMCELKAEQLELLSAYCEAWGEDYVYGDCLGAFSEGAFSGAENVRPSNIDGFVVYLQELNSQFSQE